MTFPFLDEITALVKTVLAGRLAPGVDDYLDLYVEDGVLELPFGAEGRKVRLTGKAAIAAYLSTINGRSHPEQLEIIACHPCADDVVVAEYRGRVHLPGENTWFDQRYITVFQLRDGRLALFREYFDPTAPDRAA